MYHFCPCYIGQGLVASSGQSTRESGKYCFHFYLESKCRIGECLIFTNEKTNFNFSHVKILKNETDHGFLPQKSNSVTMDSIFGCPTTRDLGWELTYLKKLYIWWRRAFLYTTTVILLVGFRVIYLRFPFFLPVFQLYLAFRRYPSNQK